MVASLMTRDEVLTGDEVGSPDGLDVGSAGAEVGSPDGLEVGSAVATHSVKSEALVGWSVGSSAMGSIGVMEESSRVTSLSTS